MASECTDPPQLQLVQAVESAREFSEKVPQTAAMIVEAGKWISQFEEGRNLLHTPNANGLTPRSKGARALMLTGQLLDVAQPRAKRVSVATALASPK